MFALPSVRLTYLIIFLGCAGLIATGMYMQYVLNLWPCALCITQRIFIVATGVIGLIAALHNPAALGRRLYSLAGALLAATGAAFAARHVWLQNLPPEEVPGCGPGFDVIWSNYPFMQALDVLLKGDGNCAEVSATFLGLTIPGWTFVAFAGLVILWLWQLLRRPS